jgi:hypothetical protein
MSSFFVTNQGYQYQLENKGQSTFEHQLTVKVSIVDLDKLDESDTVNVFLAVKVDHSSLIIFILGDILVFADFQIFILFYCQDIFENDLPILSPFSLFLTILVEIAFRFIPLIELLLFWKLEYLFHYLVNFLHVFLSESHGASLDLFVV